MQAAPNTRSLAAPAVHPSPRGATASSSLAQYALFDLVGTVGRSVRCLRGPRWARQPPLVFRTSSVLWDLAVELARVEVVPPGFDLSVVDLEGSHNLQVECLAGKREDVDPLRHHDRTVGGDVDDAELNALDAGRAGTDERRDVFGNVLFAGDRLERNVVVHGVVGEERG